MAGREAAKAKTKAADDSAYGCSRGRNTPQVQSGAALGLGSLLGGGKASKL